MKTIFKYDDGDIFSIEGTQYELSQAASGNWCVTVDRYGKEPLIYSCGTYTAALEFILNDCYVENKYFE